MDGATVMPSPASSPQIRRYPCDSFSRASRSTIDRTLRCVAGRPERPRRDSLAHRRRTMSRCQRKIVPGVTISRIAARRSVGTVPASSASHARVRPRQTRMSARPLAFSHSELMAQHKDLGVLPPPLPPRQAQQRHGTGDHQEDQPHACKPKIIPRPGRRGAEQPAVNGASGQVAQVFGTHRPEDRQEKSGKTEKVVIWPA